MAVEGGAIEMVEATRLYQTVQSPSPPPRERPGEGLPPRPSVRLGRQLSMKRKRKVGKAAADGGEREEEPIQRNLPQYRSLQHRPKKSESPVRMRRASSLTGVNRYEQWEELTFTFGNLRRSSRRLEDRIARQ